MPAAAEVEREARRHRRWTSELMPDRNPLIPPGAGTTIAKLLRRMRDDVCTIQQPISGLDATGAPLSGYATATVVPCRVITPGRQPIESVGGGRFAPVVDYEVLFAPDVPITSNDHILVNGRLLLVTADQDAVSHGFQTKVLAKAIEA